MGGNKRVMLVLFVTIVLSCVLKSCLAKSVIVGGSSGWTIPTTPTFYSSWASSQKLQLGDVLVFTFPAGVHTVAEVSKANYDACGLTNTLGPVMTTAPANITLTKPGTHYFICTITGHCSANQKLTVSVTAPTPTPAPKRSPISSPKSSPVPSPKSSPIASPTPSPTASPSIPPASSPTPTPASSAFSPAPTPVGSGPVSSAPTAGADVPGAASEPAGGDGAAASPESPPAGNAAGSINVSLLSLFSVVVMALLF